MADEGIYVVVTIADNGVIHAWGDGPVHDPKAEEVVPFTTRTDARRVAESFRREERERLTRPGETGSLQVKVCKVLGTIPTPVEP